MPLAFPLALADFWLKLPLSTLEFRLGEAVVHDRLEDGTVLPWARGQRLWQGRARFGRLTYAESAEAEALMDLVRQPGASFLACDSRRPGPLADPAGTVLGAAVPVINLVGAGSGDRDIRIGALPAGYVLSPGDRIGFAYGPANGRLALHVVATGATANGSGQTGNIQVEPPLRPGFVLDEPVVLVRPAVKAMAVPGSFDAGQSRRGIAEGAAFEFVQTLG